MAVIHPGVGTQIADRTTPEEEAAQAALARADQPPVALDPDADPGAGPERVLEELDRPNGLCFSPDGSRLYVVDSGATRRIHVYDVTDDGLGAGRVFADMSCSLGTAAAAVSAPRARARATRSSVD